MPNGFRPVETGGAIIYKPFKMPWLIDLIDSIWRGSPGTE